MNTIQSSEVREVPYWNQLKDLSNEDKMALIIMLRQSIREPQQEKETFEEKCKRAISLEEFRKRCHQRIKELYGQG